MSAGTNEVRQGFDWLVALLGADSALTAAAPGGVWRGMAPPGTPTPFVVLSMQSAPDTLSANAIRLLAQPLYQVVAYGPASQYNAIASAADRLDALLARTSVSAGGISILACYRESEIALDELISGTGAQWSRLGGLYRILN
jgi:hypothetical protein